MRRKIGVETRILRIGEACVHLNLSDSQVSLRKLGTEVEVSDVDLE